MVLSWRDLKAAIDAMGEEQLDNDAHVFLGATAELLTVYGFSQYQEEDGTNAGYYVIEADS